MRILIGYAAEMMFGKDRMISGIVKTFAAGNCNKRFQQQSNASIDESYKVHRSELVSRLQNLIQSRGYASKYTVIVGENGVGKTTAIMDALCSIEGRKGAIYFLIENPVRFSRRLSEVLNYRISTSSVFDSILLSLSMKSEYTVDPALDHEPLATWYLIQPAIVKAAQIYKEKYHQIITLILDGIDLVAKFDTEKVSPALSILGALQIFAKNMADQKLVHVMFVTSDGVSLSFLSKSSAITRAALYEVGDISDAQAVKYLKKRGVEEGDAARAVKWLTGGRFEIILDFYGFQADGLPLDEILHRRHIKIGDSLSKLNMTCDHELFRTLYEKPVVNPIQIRQHGVSLEMQEALVRSNVLSQHVNMSYSFHDRSVRSFFQMAWNKSESKIFHRAAYC
jgi:hypothetical protein